MSVEGEQKKCKCEMTPFENGVLRDGQLQVTGRRLSGWRERILYPLRNRATHGVVLVDTTRRARKTEGWDEDRRPAACNSAIDFSRIYSKLRCSLTHYYYTTTTTVCTTNEHRRK